ncbi:MAG: SAM-dependent chlorinase/fluorinase [Planctomycetia bacterium]|nr:SAM-dependent chlorinase/fluorinase [Planctomycetia bacterium]
MTSTPIITLTSDFGRASPYVAVMKGVILSINPAACIVDLTHDIRPQDIRHASYILGTAAPYFPPLTIHVCVVDPGVGSERAAICARADPHYFIGPDNGVFTNVFREHMPPNWIRRLTEPSFWRKNPPSDTFHGRDIFAPVAAHLSRGADSARLGPELMEPVLLPMHSAITFGNRWQGEIQFVDDFGNLITNIPASGVTSLPVKVSVGGRSLGVVRWVRTYSEAKAGELVSLFSSDGFFEIAQVKENASTKLNISAGTPVELEWD